MEEIKVTINEDNRSDIIRQVLDSEVCKHFTDKQPYYILLFIDVMGEAFDKIAELSRMQQVADIMKMDESEQNDEYMKRKANPSSLYGSLVEEAVDEESTT